MALRVCFAQHWSNQRLMAPRMQHLITASATDGLSALNVTVNKWLAEAMKWVGKQSKVDNHARISGRRGQICKSTDGRIGGEKKNRILVAERSVAVRTRRPGISLLLCYSARACSCIHWMARVEEGRNAAEWCVVHGGVRDTAAATARGGKQSAQYGQERIQTRESFRQRIRAWEFRLALYNDSLFRFVALLFRGTGP